MYATIALERRVEGMKGIPWRIVHVNLDLITWLLKHLHVTHQLHSWLINAFTFVLTAKSWAVSTRPHEKTRVIVFFTFLEQMRMLRSFGSCVRRTKKAQCFIFVGFFLFSFILCFIILYFSLFPSLFYFPKTKKDHELALFSAKSANC